MTDAPALFTMPDVPMTVRRMRGGGFGLYLGDVPVAGVSGVAVMDDGTNSIVTVQFNAADVFFDTEKIAPENPN